MKQWKWYAYELLGVWWQRKDENIKWPSASADLSAISYGSSGTGRPLLSLGLGHSLFRSGFQFHFLGFWVCALFFKPGSTGSAKVRLVVTRFALLLLVPPHSLTQ